jgi:ABC-type arginine transport system permease subunit
MSIKTAEESLAKYHLLHYVIGAIFAAILLGIPKLIGVLVCVFLLALFLPSIVLPEFMQNKWYDRAAVVLGAVTVGVIFHLLHRL